MYYCKLLFAKEFKKKSSKEAYLQCCKYIANHIVSKQYENLFYNIIKENVDNEYIVKLNVYISIDLRKEKEHHCNICKQFRTLFYISEQSDCNNCSMNALFKRVKENEKIIKTFYKEKGEF